MLKFGSAHRQLLLSWDQWPNWVAEVRQSSTCLSRRLLNQWIIINYCAPMTPKIASLDGETSYAYRALFV